MPQKPLRGGECGLVTKEQPRRKLQLERALHRDNLDRRPAPRPGVGAIRMTSRGEWRA